jgi:hypothetical protein
VKKEDRTVTVPRGIVTVPEGDPVRVRLEWRTGLVKLKLQRQEEDEDGTKEKEGE